MHPVILKGNKQFTLTGKPIKHHFKMQCLENFLALQLLINLLLVLINQRNVLFSENVEEIHLEGVSQFQVLVLRPVAKRIMVLQRKHRRCH